MTAEVVAEIEEQVAQLRAAGQVPADLESELDARFEAAAEASLAAARLSAPRSSDSGETRTGSRAAPTSAAGLAEISRQATMLARRRFGPALRRLERRAALGTARAGEKASTQAHVTADRLERLVARSSAASRVLSAARARASSDWEDAGTQPPIEGALFDWVLEHLSVVTTGRDDADAQRLVLHAECGDGRVVEALAARGLDARGADPRRSARASGDANIVGAGAFEYLGATPHDTLEGLLLTGVVDRLRPGAARALAQLAATRLAPGGVVVLVSTRPETATAIDPVASDLASGRPVHPVTWCHLLARYGLSELSVFEPDSNEPDLFAVSAKRPVPPWPFGGDVR